jgi:aspartate aminotransferase-like enzyme
MIRKKRLMTPGPAPVHPRAIAAAVEPLPHHRAAEFKPRFAAVQTHLQAAFRTAGPVNVLASSGTGAMEAALTNLFAAGDRVLVVANGKFGARWAEVAECFGMRVRAVPVAPGETFGRDEIAEAVAAFRPVQGVVLTASETSTGGSLDIRALVNAARRVEPEVAVVVDAITAIGAMPIETDRWELDAVCGGSQKAFMVPPGLGFVACSPRGWARVREARPKPRYYFDLRKYGDRAADDQTPFTPATSLILELEAALIALDEAGGIAALEANASRLAAATRAAAKALGLDLLSPLAPSAAVTAIRAPRSGMAPEIVAAMRQDHGVFIAGGQGELKPDLIRIGHLGYIDEVDLLGTLATLERVLVKLGVSVEIGTANAAALDVLDAQGGE